MSPSAPRRTQNHQPPTASNPLAHDSHGYPHAHGHGHDHGHDHGHGHVHDYGHGHARTRSRQLQAEAQQEQQQPQQQQQQQQRLAPSDYESDTPQYMAPQPAMSPATMAARTNTELNLAVLRRYLPSITAILSIASNGVVYTFQPPSGWGRTTLEGPMFICSQRKSPSDAQDTACLFIINRKGLQNFVLDLDTVGNFELAGDLFIFQLDYAAHELQLETGESVKPQVLGLWSYAEHKTDREANAALINDLWSRALATRDARVAASDPAALAALAEGAPAARATGRRLSVSDLFSAYNGTTIPAQGP